MWQLNLKWTNYKFVGSRDVFLCGTFAGLSYCITHPLEAVKTRVQVKSAFGKHRGFLSSLVRIVKREGKVITDAIYTSTLGTCYQTPCHCVLYCNSEMMKYFEHL